MAFKSKQCGILIRMLNSEETAVAQTSKLIGVSYAVSKIPNMTADRFSMRSNLEQSHVWWAGPEAAAEENSWKKSFKSFSVKTKENVKLTERVAMETNLEGTHVWWARPEAAAEQEF